MSSGEQVDVVSTTQEVPVDNDPTKDQVGDSAESVNGQDPKKKATKRVKSRFKGVFKCGKKFKAQIQTHGVQHYLGLFDTEEDAARAYDTHARLVLGMKAKTNFDYDPRDMPDESLLPSPPTLPPPTVPRILIGEEGASKNSQIRRSYVGMKMRKKSRMETSPPTVPVLAPTTVIAPPSLLPPSLPQSRFNLSNLSRAMMQQQQHAQSQLLRLPATTLGGLIDAMDWSKHPYTPLEINAPVAYQALQPLGEPDWRDQIYYWTGALVYSDEERCLVWTGRWLGSFTGRPTTEEFESSHNDFRYNSPYIEKERVVSGSIIRPASGNYKGFYLTDGDNGGELEKFEETNVLLDFEEASKSTGHYSVYGQGDSEFGGFILNGNYDTGSGVLNMTRQYLSDGDPRSTMKLSALKEYFKRLNGLNR